MRFLFEPEEREFRDSDSRQGFLNGFPKRNHAVHGFFANAFAVVEESRLGEVGVDDIDFGKFGIPRLAVNEDAVSRNAVVPVELWKVGHEFWRPRRNDDFQSVGIEPFDLGLPDIFLHGDDRPRNVGRTNEEYGHPVEFFDGFVGDVDVASGVHAFDDDFGRGDAEVRRSEGQVTGERHKHGGHRERSHLDLVSFVPYLGVDGRDETEFPPSGELEERRRLSCRRFGNEVLFRFFLMDLLSKIPPLEIPENRVHFDFQAPKLLHVFGKFHQGVREPSLRG